VFFHGLGAPDSVGEVVHALFRCDAGKTVTAVFSHGRRSVSLPQSRSGSGARYANAAQSFVFRNKGDTAFIDENDQTRCSGCSTRP
jgi:membrane-bound inhibitor of C-type lysozyme